MLNVDIPMGAWRVVDLEALGVNPEWRFEYEINDGEWTKRVLLVKRRWW
jgi:hypothetical protein